MKELAVRQRGLKKESGIENTAGNPTLELATKAPQIRYLHSSIALSRLSSVTISSTVRSFPGVAWASCLIGVQISVLFFFNDETFAP